MSRFVLNQTHPLIPREQNYVLDRKIITIHSNDRDISKWPKQLLEYDGFSKFVTTKEDKLKTKQYFFDF